MKENIQAYIDSFEDITILIDKSLYIQQKKKKDKIKSTWNFQACGESESTWLFEFMEDKADEQQKDNYRSHYRNNRSNTLERCFYKCLK